MKHLNLACGPTYIVDGTWINVDFREFAEEVIGHNLLSPLPFESDSFNLVYCSHFLEHIPKDLVRGFLRECHRILRTDGVLRLVVPDCEEMFSTFLSLRHKGLHEEADFLIVEIIDQCVRKWPGGALGAFYSEVRSMDCDKRDYWLRFLAMRNGEGLEMKQEPTAISPHKHDMNHKSHLALLHRLARLHKRVRQAFRMKMHRLGLNLLLPAFREQNVSFTSVGETHCWLWDFHQLQEELVVTGFSSVTRQSHLRSYLPEFPFVPLDSTADGMPRKGKESMYVESIKS